MASELDRLINTCLIPGFDGDEVPEWVEEAVGNGLGGVCVYGANITAVEGDLIRLTKPLRALRDDFLVAVDEEAGDVTRLFYREGSAYPGNLALGQIDDVGLTEAVGRAVGGDLARLEINYTYAPSVDVNSEPKNPVIGTRSFGSDPDLVGRHGAAFIKGVQSCGVATSAKHFPGHGATNVDSHLGLPSIDCDEKTFRERELAPFVAAIEAGATSIMTSHVVFREFDDLPATLSRRFLTDLLRGELGYEGVLTTDALDMKAVSERWGHAGCAAMALAAGADALLLGPGDCEALCEEVRTLVRGMVESGEIPLAQLERSAERVRKLGRWASNPEVPVDVERGVGLVAARRAVVSRGAVPLASAPHVIEVRGEINQAVGDAHWSLAEQLGALDFLAGSARVGEADAGAPLPVTDAPLVIACRDAYRVPWQSDWVARARAGRPDAVVVGMGLPFDGDIAGDTFVATFGAGRVNAMAAAETLSGRTFG